MNATDPASRFEAKLDNYSVCDYSMENNVIFNDK